MFRLMATGPSSTRPKWALQPSPSRCWILASNGTLFYHFNLSYNLGVPKFPQLGFLETRGLYKVKNSLIIIKKNCMNCWDRPIQLNAICPMNLWFSWLRSEVNGSIALPALGSTQGDDPRWPVDSIAPMKKFAGKAARPTWLCIILYMNLFEQRLRKKWSICYLSLLSILMVDT